MWLIAAELWCTECDYKYEGRNAMGLAAIHHKKTGHYVQVQLVYGQHFGESKPIKERLES